MRHPDRLDPERAEDERAARFEEGVPYLADAAFGAISRA